MTKILAAVIQGRLWAIGFVQVDSSMTDIDSRFEALQNRYRAALARKRAEITQPWQALRRDCADAENQQGLLRLVHRLAGSGESCGFAEVGRLAARTDLLLDQVRRNADPMQRTAALNAILDPLAHAVQVLLDGLKRGIDPDSGNEYLVA